MLSWTRHSALTYVDEMHLSFVSLLSIRLQAQDSMGAEGRA